MAIKRKTTTAIVASVAAAALILGGTFAWTSISQEAKNETIVDINPGGRLHDDFNGTNKDVYVENFGDNETGVPIFARIRLDEYMEVGPDAGINKDVADRSVEVIYPADKAKPDINNVATWITYIPGDSDTTNAAVENKDREYGYYWDWALGNDDQNLPYYMPTFNKNKDSLLADINGTYEGNIVGDIVHYDDYVPYENGDSIVKDATYDWDEDTDEDYATETRNENTPFDTVDVLKKQETHDATQISSTAEVITMAEWLAPVASGGKGGERGNFWVYDEDGWAYWANPIEPGTTTGLLLDGINMSRTPGDNWYYGINVVAQFATASDLGMFENPTDNAKELLKVVSVEKTIKAILTANGQTVDDGTGTQVPAYTLSFVNDRETYTADDVATTAEGLEITPIATYKDTDIVAVYSDLVGKKLYSSDADVPWSEYASLITHVSIDSEIQPIYMARWFIYFKNLTTVEGLDKIDTSNTKSLRSMFHTCSSLTKIEGISGWNTSNVDDMSHLFKKCSSLAELDDISQWDTRNVTLLFEMFNECSMLTSIDLSGPNWDTSKVENMSTMFYNCSSLESITGIDGWNTSNVTYMQGMFYGCNNANFTTLDLSNWDTSKVENMLGMFQGCTNLTSITGIENFKTGNVTTMESMFDSTGITGTLDLTGWETGKVTDMYRMFYNSKGITSLDLGGWDTSSVIRMRDLFWECSSLATLDLTGWVTSSATSVQFMFAGCSSLTTLISDISNWDTSKVTNMQGTFLGCTNLTADCSKWDVGKATVYDSFALNAPNVTLPDAWTTAYVLLTPNSDTLTSGGTAYTMTFMRAETAPVAGDTYNGAAITAVFTDFENLNVGTNVETALPWHDYRASITTINFVNNLYPICTSYWFHSMTNVTAINGLEKIDTSNTTSLQLMFWGCSSLTSLEGMSEWDLSKAEAINSIFSNCTALTDVGDISNWNVSNVENMQAVFYRTAFTSIDISGWDTSSVKNMIHVFAQNSNLQSITLGTGWNTSNVTTMHRMFQFCTALSIDCSTWNVDNVTDYTDFRVTSETDSTPISTITPPTWKH